MLPIMSEVPIPARVEPEHKRKYPLAEMAVGDMFFVNGMESNKLANYVSAAGKRLGRKFRTRFCIMKRVPGGYWTPCRQSDKGATCGVGVWRDE